MAGCGAGAGFSSERLDPRMVPGCVLMACTDTTTFPTAVVWPADVVVNGTFAADANWTKGAGWTIPTPYALHTAGNTATLSEAVLTVGNTYTTRIVITNATAGTVTVLAGTTAGTARFNGDFTESLLCAGNTTLAVTPSNDFDGQITLVKADPRNASRFTDLNGTGHHLLQATAASQPLWVASGAGGVLRTDGAADYLKAVAFALNRPAHIFAVMKPSAGAASACFLDGNTVSTATVFRESGADPTTLNMYAGNYLRSGTGVVVGAWLTSDTLFNAASSTLGINGGTVVAGNAGNGNPAGFTLGARGDNALWGAADYAAVIVYNRALSEPERQRVVRWCNRLRGRLAI
jgi:hypothetical protein